LTANEKYSIFKSKRFGDLFMILKDLASIPSAYRDRIEKVKQVKPTISGTSIIIQNPHIMLSSGKYSQEILFLGEVDPDTNIKIYCSCPSFNYEFAHILNDNECLLHPERFRIAIRKTPREKNQKNVLTGCKHSIAAAQFIQKNIDKFQKIYKEKLNVKLR